MNVKLGLMGFGNIGRKIYNESLKNKNIDVAAICDIGDPKILTYLLKNEFDSLKDIKLDGNYLVSHSKKTRFLTAMNPGDVPWDLFGVDIVVDATGKFKSREKMKMHLDAGAKKVILSSLPEDKLDRVVICGVNEKEVSADDKTISAGSSTMNALALLLKPLVQLGITSVNMTTIHSYTSDQALQDVVGTDFRKSRSASENIIPNSSETQNWISDIFPSLEGKVICSALNVPVQKGSMIDLTLSFSDNEIDCEKINNIIIEASKKYPKIIGYTEDPVVSSDIIGDPRSVVLDTRGTLKAGSNFIKILGWYDNGHCHANRILDVAEIYSKLEGFK